MSERAHEGGLRSCSIHSFYHGALRPWDDEGKDQWWRYSPTELRSVQDVCSEEDIDQLETVDHHRSKSRELAIHGWFDLAGYKTAVTRGNRTSGGVVTLTCPTDRHGLSEPETGPFGIGPRMT